jgi:hypothetical protein
MNSDQKETPLALISLITRVVGKSVDQIFGDRTAYPLYTVLACVEGLKYFGINALPIYGKGAWVEVLEDHRVVWAGFWQNEFHFWVQTEYGEIVDLITSVAYRKKIATYPTQSVLYSPPLLWAKEVPNFYYYKPEGVAELEGDQQINEDFKKYKALLDRTLFECQAFQEEQPPSFINEPLLVSGRKILDDTHQSFLHFDRVLSLKGIPQAPFI